MLFFIQTLFMTSICGHTMWPCTTPKGLEGFCIVMIVIKLECTEGLPPQVLLGYVSWMTWPFVNPYTSNSMTLTHDMEVTSRERPFERTSGQSYCHRVRHRAVFFSLSNETNGLRYWAGNQARWQDTNGCHIYLIAIEWLQMLIISNLRHSYNNINPSFIVFQKVTPLFSSRKTLKNV